LKPFRVAFVEIATQKPIEITTRKTKKLAKGYIFVESKKIPVAELHSHEENKLGSFRFDLVLSESSGTQHISWKRFWT
jgi:hypothetical protein